MIAKNPSVIYTRKKGVYVMDKKDLQILWKTFLMRNDLDIKTVAEKKGCFPQNLGRKVNSGSIKLLEFANILEMYGYELDIKKKSE